MKKQEDNMVSLSPDKQAFATLNSVLELITTGSKKEFQNLKILTPLSHNGNALPSKTLKQHGQRPKN